jgi:tetratricopeptide (TPR) repeat protein
MGQTPKAIEALNRVLNHSNVNVMALRSLSRAFSDLTYTNGLKEVAAKLETVAKANPDDYEARLGLAETYRRLQQNASAVMALEPILTNPNPNPAALRYAAQEYNDMRDIQKLEVAIEKLAKAMPDSAEAWYDLSGLKASLGKAPEALTALKRMAEISTARRKTNSAAQDLVAKARQDPAFGLLRQNPEFTQITGAK